MYEYECGKLRVLDELAKQVYNMNNYVDVYLCQQYIWYHNRVAQDNK